MAEESSKAFYWSGYDRQGNKVTNRKVVAPSTDDVAASLTREGSTPVSIKENAGMNLNMTIGDPYPKYKWAKKADFARRVYQMLRAGISLPAGLESIAQDLKGPEADMVNDIAKQVRAGQSFALSLNDYPRAFDDIFVAYVASGEEAGTLVETMERLSIMLAKRAAMQSKIKAVMAYPKFVSAAIGIIVLGIIMFLVPRFVEIYESFGAEIPGPTMFLLGVSKNIFPVCGPDTEVWITKIPLGPIAFNPFSVFMLVVYGIIGWKFFRKKTMDNEGVNVFLDKVKFKSPLLGKLNHKSALYRWSATLSGALSSGVHSTRAVELASEASGSNWMRITVRELVDDIRSGKTISSHMDLYPELYPTNIRSMVSTGEATGEVDTMLETVSLTLDEEIDAIIATLAAKMEVALLLVLGLVVGALLIALYLPIIFLAVAASKGLGG